MTTKDLLVTAVILLTAQGALVLPLLYMILTALRELVHQGQSRGDRPHDGLGLHDSSPDEPIGTYQPAAVDHWYQKRRPLPPDLDEP